MKQLILTFVIAFVFSACQSNTTQDIDVTQDSDTLSVVVPDTIPGSPLRTVEGTIGGSSVTIEYSSPAVRERVIWGELVPFDTVWVTGAHDATSFTFSSDVTIADTVIPAGKYAFFSIPGRESWTLIINRNWDQHLARNYSESEDVIRFEVTPTIVEHTERLVYAIEPQSDNSAIISMTWERVRVEFEVRQ